MRYREFLLIQLFASCLTICAEAQTLVENRLHPDRDLESDKSRCALYAEATTAGAYEQSNSIGSAFARGLANMAMGEVARSRFMSCLGVLGWTQVTSGRSSAGAGESRVPPPPSIDDSDGRQFELEQEI